MMSSTNRFGALILAAALATGLLLVLVLRAEPAEAAFPGANGKIVFASNRTSGVNNPEGDFEIFTMDPNGTNLTQLTKNVANDADPAWSPDGTEVAFVSERDGGDLEIYRMNAVDNDADGNGDNQLRLTNNSGEDSAPAWSPDETRIAFTSERDGNRDVYRMSANGSNQVRLTKSSALDGQPAWSPDGTKIAFASNRSGGPSEVYVMKARPEGRKNRPTNLSRHSSAVDLTPNWSPDGKQITFASNRGVGGDFEVYTMDPNGLDQTPLTENRAFDAFPLWSPDGTNIAFVSSRDFNGEIYAMNSDGSNETNITNNPAVDQDPDWQRT